MNTKHSQSSLFKSSSRYPTTTTTTATTFSSDDSQLDDSPAYCYRHHHYRHQPPMTSSTLTSSEAAGRGMTSTPAANCPCEHVWESPLCKMAAAASNERTYSTVGSLHVVPDVQLAAAANSGGGTGGNDDAETSSGAAVTSSLYVTSAAGGSGALRKTGAGALFGDGGCGAVTAAAVTARDSGTYSSLDGRTQFVNV